MPLSTVFPQMIACFFRCSLPFSSVRCLSLARVPCNFHRQARTVIALTCFSACSPVDRLLPSSLVLFSGWPFLFPSLIESLFYCWAAGLTGFSCSGSKGGSASSSKSSWSRSILTSSRTSWRSLKRCWWSWTMSPHCCSIGSGWARTPSVSNWIRDGCAVVKEDRSWWLDDGLGFGVEQVMVSFFFSD